MEKQKLIIRRLLACTQLDDPSIAHYLADAWVASNNLLNNEFRCLWRNGDIRLPACDNLNDEEESREVKKQNALSSPKSAWCETKEEAIALCEKFGYPYEVVES